MTYLPQPLPEWQGNPLIEALPPLMGEEEAYRRLNNRPAYDPAIREATKEVRQHALLGLERSFIALPRHQRLVTAISRLIRNGYVHRNPMNRDYWTRRRRSIEEFNPKRAALRRHGQDTRAPLSGSLIGISGTGKTTCVREILQTYPQVIEHGLYQGEPLNLRQVVYLRLETPQDSSRKALCRSFFTQLDGLLDTDYQEHYGKGNVDELMQSMAQLASLHEIGLLVIDEIQELSNAKAGGAGMLLGFFLELMNTIGVPMLLIGTHRSSLVLNAQLRHRRRLNSIGLPIWKPLEPGPEFDTVVETLWPYQYTRIATPLTDDLKSRLFRESQGIVDFVIKLFMNAQDRLITIGREGDARPEAITPDLISTVAVECLHAARPVIEALQRGDQAQLELLDDVPNQVFLDLMAISRRVQANEPLPEPSNASPGIFSGHPNRPGEKTPGAAQGDGLTSISPSGASTMAAKAQSEGERLACELRDAIISHREELLDASSILQAIGAVRPALEFWG